MPEKLIPGKQYKKSQLERVLSQEKARKLIYRGYIIEHDLRADTYAVVHWTNRRGLEDGVASGLQVYDPYAFTPPDPIQRRTAMQRKQSLIDKWWADCKKAGTVPGLSDEQVTAIIGQSWKSDEMEMTGEVIERLAAAMLGQAETKQNVDDFKKVVKDPGHNLPT